MIFSNTLGSMIYHIACYPEVQETIFNEIIDNIGSDDITHDNISKLDYLEAVITGGAVNPKKSS